MSPNKSDTIRTGMGVVLSRPQPLNEAFITVRPPSKRGRTPPGSSAAPIGRRYLNVHETATMTGLAPTTLYKPAWKQRFKAVKVGRCLKFDRHAVEREISRNRIVRES